MEPIRGKIKAQESVTPQCSEKDCGHSTWAMLISRWLFPHSGDICIKFSGCNNRIHSIISFIKQTFDNNLAMCSNSLQGRKSQYKHPGLFQFLNNTLTFLHTAAL